MLEALTPAAKEKMHEPVLSLAATLSENRIRASGASETPRINPWQLVSSTLRPACGYFYGETAAGRLVGLDYAWNRYYSSNWGRFLNPDPYMANGGGSGDPADPQSWNRYAYAGGDPVNLYDPTGRMFVLTWSGEHAGSWIIDDSPAPGGGATVEPAPFRNGKSSIWYFPKCNPDNDMGKGSQLAFLAVAYPAAAAAAAGIQSSIASTGQQINQTNVAEAFLDQSALESDWGDSGIAINNHNYFGASAGNWGGAAGAANCSSFANPGFACFPSTDGWGDELQGILSFAPHSANNLNPGNATYSAFIAAALIGNPNASPAAILQTMANAGYNPSPNYGASIAGAGRTMQQTIDPLLQCMFQNGYLKP